MAAEDYRCHAELGDLCAATTSALDAFFGEPPGEPSRARPTAGARLNDIPCLCLHEARAIPVPTTSTTCSITESAP